jgi:hypothetical protein
MTPLSAIPIKEPWIDMILSRKKTWEIRSKFTKKIGLVALIRSGLGTVVAVAKLSKVIQLTQSIARKNVRLMGVSRLSEDEALNCDGAYAWVLKVVIKFKTPVPYKHPPGAVTWVTLDEQTTKKVLAETKHSIR